MWFILLFAKMVSFDFFKVKHLSCDQKKEIFLAILDVPSESLVLNYKTLEDLLPEESKSIIRLNNDFKELIKKFDDDDIDIDDFNESKKKNIKKYLSNFYKRKIRTINKDHIFYILENFDIHHFSFEQIVSVFNALFYFLYDTTFDRKKNNTSNQISNFLKKYKEYESKIKSTMENYIEFTQEVTNINGCFESYFLDKKNEIIKLQEMCQQDVNSLGYLYLFSSESELKKLGNRLSKIKSYKNNECRQFILDYLIESKYGDSFQEYLKKIVIEYSLLPFDLMNKKNWTLEKMIFLVNEIESRKFPKNVFNKIPLTPYLLVNSGEKQNYDGMTNDFLEQNNIIMTISDFYFDLIFHELGHVFEFRNYYLVDNFMQNHIKSKFDCEEISFSENKIEFCEDNENAYFITDYARKSPSEYFAELFPYFLSYPHYLSQDEYNFMDQVVFDKAFSNMVYFYSKFHPMNLNVFEIFFNTKQTWADFLFFSKIVYIADSFESSDSNKVKKDFIKYIPYLKELRKKFDVDKDFPDDIIKLDKVIKILEA